MKTSWNQMIVLGSFAMFFTAYAPQNAVAQEQAVKTSKEKQEVDTKKKELLDSTDEMKSLVPEESTLTPEEEMKLRVNEENVFDENQPG
jgi:hypothetical protein